MPRKSHIDRFIDSLDLDGKIAVKDKLNSGEHLPDDIYAAFKRNATEITMLGEWVEPAMEYVENYGKIVGLRTGYDSIDELTKGLKPGDLTIIAGQPSHGKTLIGNNIAYRIAKGGTPVLFVTLEMTKTKVTARFIKIAQDDGTDPSELPIYYQSLDWVKANDMPQLIERAIAEAGVKVVIIDHLHVMADRDSGDMRSEIGAITRSMKRLAIKHDIPIVLMAQVRRLQDPKAKPQNHDLKETGYIEQDADIILMVWRDISPDSIDTNYVEIYCTKNRDNGFTSERIKSYKQIGSTLYEITENPETGYPQVSA